MTKAEKDAIRKEKAQIKKKAKDLRRVKAAKKAQKTAAIDEQKRRDEWQKTIMHYGQNRALRRKFAKQAGVMIPPLHMPHVKADGWDKCICDQCIERRNAKESKDNELQREHSEGS